MNAAIDPHRGRLEQLLQISREDATPTSDCPPAEHLWEAVSGELDPAEASLVVEHIAGCGACSEAWAMASELGSEAWVEHLPLSKPAVTNGTRFMLAATLLVAFIGGGLWFATKTAPGNEALRGPAGAIASTVDAGTFTRTSARLSWTAVEGATGYRVVVTDGRLRLLHESEVEMTTVTLSPESLDEIEVGESVLWRVEAIIDRGQSMDSPTFETELAK